MNNYMLKKLLVGTITFTFLMLFFLLTVTAQEPESLGKPQLDIDPKPVDKESCEAVQGIWIPPVNGKVILNNGICNLRTQDPGKICEDSTECQGDCTVLDHIPRGAKVAGTCSQYLYSLTGCINRVTHGIVDGNICH